MQNEYHNWSTAQEDHSADTLSEEITLLLTPNTVVDLSEYTPVRLLTAGSLIVPLLDTCHQQLEEPLCEKMMKQKNTPPLLPDHPSSTRTQEEHCRFLMPERTR